MDKQPTVNLLDLSLAELSEFFQRRGEPAFRAMQVWKWIHQHGVSDFQRMTNLSKDLRSSLAAVAEVRAPRVVQHQPSEDGTHKWLLQLDDQQCIEMVFIPEKDRGTLCVSSQVGCALDCTFCSTARQGFNRNLNLSEIIGQVWLANKLLQPEELTDQDAPLHRSVTNVVMMGMGEPLANYNNVIAAMQVMLDDNAYGLSKRRVTLSTSGIVPAMYRLAEDIDVVLAVSLHAPNDALRDQLVPINKKYPIKELLAACQNYLKDKSHRERITFEYVMLAGVNDSNEQADQLAELLEGMPAKLNLIPFNIFPGTKYKCSSGNAINRFRDRLMSHGVKTMTRKTRGDDIDAACGQLAGQVNDRSRRELRFAKMELEVQT